MRSNYYLLAIICKLKLMAEYKLVKIGYKQKCDLDLVLTRLMHLPLKMKVNWLQGLLQRIGDRIQLTEVNHAFGIKFPANELRILTPIMRKELQAYSCGQLLENATKCYAKLKDIIQCDRKSDQDKLTVIKSNDNATTKYYLAEVLAYLFLKDQAHICREILSPAELNSVDAMISLIGDMPANAFNVALNRVNLPQMDLLFPENGNGYKLQLN